MWGAVCLYALYGLRAQPTLCSARLFPGVIAIDAKQRRSQIIPVAVPSPRVVLLSPGNGSDLRAPRRSLSVPRQTWIMAGSVASQIVDPVDVHLSLGHLPNARPKMTQA